MARTPNPNLFNLDPAAFRLNAGGRSFDRMQRVAPSRSVWNQGGNDPYAIALKQIQDAQGQLASSRQAFADNSAKYNAAVADANRRFTEAKNKAGSDITGNVALASIPVIGPVLAAGKLIGKVGEAAFEDEAAIARFAEKYVSGEAGDAVGTAGEVFGGVASGISMAGNAIGDVISGGVIGDLGGRAVTNAVGDVAANILKGFGSGSVTTVDRSGQPAYAKSMFDTFLAQNPGIAYDDSFRDKLRSFTYDELYRRSGATISKSMLDQLGSLTYWTDREYMPHMLNLSNDYFLEQRKSEITNKLKEYSTDVGNILTEAQGVLGSYEQQQADLQAQQDAAARKQQSAQQFRTDYQTSRELQRQMVEQNIQPQVQQSGARLAQTGLYSDDLHQQMMVRNK